MFEMPILKQHCENFLLDYIDFDNVIKLYTISHRHNAFQLKNICIDFLIRNGMQTTREFIELDKELKEEVYAKNNL